jgi:Peptidase A4 family
MARRWCMPLLILLAAAGSALTAGAASASSLSARRAAPAAAHPVRPGNPDIRVAGGALPSATGGHRPRRVESANWSGYAATGGHGTFHSVSASWTEPAVHCPGRGATYAAFWVGLDGYRSRSVEQTGSDADCHGKTPRYYGWYEMYPAAPVKIRGKVRPGDKLSASVRFSRAKTYTLVLRDRTRGWKRTVTRKRAGLARSSAEVITEAPSSEQGVVPLADFGAVRFTAARANGHLLRRHAPTRIIMVDSRGRNQATTGALTKTGAFRTTWLRKR